MNLKSSSHRYSNRMYRRRDCLKTLVRVAGLIDLYLGWVHTQIHREDSWFQYRNFPYFHRCLLHLFLLVFREHIPILRKFLTPPLLHSLISYFHHFYCRSILRSYSASSIRSSNYHENFSMSPSWMLPTCQGNREQNSGESLEALYIYQKGLTLPYQYIASLGQAYKMSLFKTKSWCDKNFHHRQKLNTLGGAHRVLLPHLIGLRHVHNDPHFQWVK